MGEILAIVIERKNMKRGKWERKGRKRKDKGKTKVKRVK
jgi:hypothetical protein